MTAPSDEASTAARQPSGLLKILGVGFGLAVLVGNSIGMGILRTPGEVAAQLPSVPLYFAAWVAGALYALLGALTIAELATMHPRSGGLYTLVRRGLGPFPGFVSGWTDWIATCCSMAAVAIVLGEYCGPLWAPLIGHEGFIAASVVIGFALLQWRGIRLGSVAQMLTSLTKGLALIGLAMVVWLVGAGTAIDTPVAASAPAVAGGMAFAAAVVVALQSVIFTYDGWTGPIYFGEEVRDPGRDLPRAMIGGVLLVLAIYLALNLAFLQVIPIAAMAGDPFVAATVAERLFGPTGDTVLRVLMLLSLIAAVSGLQLIASRIPYAMSCDRLFPSVLSQVNHGGTPLPALLAGTTLAVLFIATNTFNTVLALLAFFFVANYALAFVALFVLRRREPDTPRPFRVPLYPWVPGLALAGSLAFLVAAFINDTDHSLMALGVVGLSWPAYWITRRLNASPEQAH